MTANDQAILALAAFASVMVLCDLLKSKPRSIFLAMAVLAIAMIPVVKRYLFQ